MSDVPDETMTDIENDDTADLPVEPEHEAEPSEPAAPSEAVLRRASNDYGLSADDLHGFDDRRAERLFAAFDRRLMRPPAQPHPAAPQPTPAGGEPIPGFSPLKIELPDDVDDSIATAFNTAQEYMNTQMKELQTFRQAMAQEIQALNLIRELTDFDRMIDSLGDDWSGQYGNGPTTELDSTSEQLRNRLDVFWGAKTLQQDAARRRQPLTMREAWRRSHGAKFLDQIAEQHGKKLGEKAERTRHASGERPSKSRGKEVVTPREAAMSAWER